MDFVTNNTWHEFLDIFYYHDAWEMNQDHLDRMLQLYFDLERQSASEFLLSNARSMLRVTQKAVLCSMGEPFPDMTFAELVKRNLLT